MTRSDHIRYDQLVQCYSKEQKVATVDALTLESFILIHIKWVAMVSTGWAGSIFHALLMLSQCMCDQWIVELHRNAMIQYRIQVRPQIQWPW